MSLSNKILIRCYLLKSTKKAVYLCNHNKVTSLMFLHLIKCFVCIFSVDSSREGSQKTCMLQRKRKCITKMTIVNCYDCDLNVSEIGSIENGFIWKQ